MIGCTGDDIYPVVAMLAYLAIHGGETRAHCFSLRMGLLSLDQPSPEESRRHSIVWDTHPINIQDTVFGQGLHS